MKIILFMKYHSELIKNVIRVYVIKQAHQYFLEQSKFLELKNKKALYSFDCRFYDKSSVTFQKFESLGARK